MAAALFLLGTMNDMTAPSVSLEDKTLWQVKCLPVTPWQALRAKLRMHLLLSGVPMLFCAGCMAVVLDAEPAARILLAAFGAASVALTALAGLFLNVNMPNLTWTTETVPIKQSAPVVIAVFGGMAYAGLLAGPWFLWKPDPTLYLALILAVTVLLCVALWFWLKTKGAKKYAAM